MIIKLIVILGLKNANDKLPTDAGNYDFNKWPLIWKDFKKQVKRILKINVIR